MNGHIVLELGVFVTFVILFKNADPIVKRQLGLTCNVKALLPFSWVTVLSNENKAELG